MLRTGVLVVAHQVEYLAPVGYGPEPLVVSLWIDALGASRFTWATTSSTATRSRPGRGRRSCPSTSTPDGFGA